jgi:hypothetical protein
MCGQGLGGGAVTLVALESVCVLSGPGALTSHRGTKGTSVCSSTPTQHRYQARSCLCCRCYKYRVTVFCPWTNKIEVVEATDPYSKCTTGARLSHTISAPLPPALSGVSLRLLA